MATEVTKGEEPTDWTKFDIDGWLRKKGFIGRVTKKELMFFYLQLSILIGAGCTILESLKGIGKQLSNPTFRTILLDLALQLERGKSFSDALRIHSRVFPEIFCSLMFIGEQTGTMDTVLQSFAEAEERSMALRRKVTGAMIYPAFLLIVSVLVVAILMVYVFPKFMKVINQPLHKLPWPTQFVMITSDFFVAYWHVVFGSLAGGVVGYLFFNSTRRGRYFFDWIKLRFPALKWIFIKADTTLFCRTLSIMLTAGLPIVKAVKIVQTTVSNLWFQDCIADLEERISRGESFTSVLRLTPRFFSETIVLLTDAGERSGNMDGMLLKIADYTDGELNDAIEGATRALEPLLISFVACVVGVITAAMFLPLFEMGKYIK